MFYFIINPGDLLYLSMITYRHFFINPIKRIVPDGGLTSIFRTIGFIGDSLSSGEHESFSTKENKKGFHDYMEYSWGQFIARKCGLTAINFSKGGLTAKDFFDFVCNKKEPLTNNIFDEKNKCQAYVIALGVNDMNHLDEKYPLGFGSFDDVDFKNEDNNKDSFVGWYVKIIQKVRKIEPKSRIFVLTTPLEKKWSKEEVSRFKKLRAFLFELAKKFEFLYVLDLFKFAPKYGTKKIQNLYFCGTHMSAAGYKFTADIVSTYIDYIIRKNPLDFKQVGFIGKDVHNELEKW